ELLDLEEIEAGVRKEVAAQLRVLLVDDPRQQLIDVESLEADLRDDLFQQRLGDRILQLAQRFVLRDLRFDLPPERLATLGRVELEVEVRHAPARDVVDREVRAL